jgi:beta-lactamase regulating signal transducer with metallopeptidase domain
MDQLVVSLNNRGAAFCEFAGAMLVQTSVLTGALVLVDLLIRKRVRASVRYWMWMLVFVKLLLPPTLALPTGVGYWLRAEPPAVAPVAEEPASVAMPMAPAPTPVSLPPYEPMEVLPAPDTSPEAIAPAVAGPTLAWQAVVFVFWLVGLVVFGLLLVQRAFFVRGLIAQSVPVDGDLAETLERCARQIGVRRRTGLRVSPNTFSPAVCGLFRPVILLPVSLLEKLSGENLRTVLIHELAHIKRGDLWINFVQTILQVLYFYNPLVWLAHAIVRHVREQAVDEMVLVALGAEATSYSKTLIDIAEMAFFRANLALRLIGVAESKKSLEGRIKHMLTRPIPKSAKIGFWGIVALGIAAATLLPMAKGEMRPSTGDARSSDSAVEPVDRTGESGRNILNKMRDSDTVFLRSSTIVVEARSAIFEQEQISPGEKIENITVVLSPVTIAVDRRISYTEMPAYRERTALTEGDYLSDGRLLVWRHTRERSLLESSFQGHRDDLMSVLVSRDGQISIQSSAAPTFDFYAPGDPQRYGWFWTPILATGRGFSQYLREVVEMHELENGLIRLEARGVSHLGVALTWNMVVDPGADYLVRSASYAYENGSFDFHSTGVKKFGLQTLAERADFGRGMTRGTRLEIRDYQPVSDSEILSGIRDAFFREPLPEGSRVVDWRTGRAQVGSSDVGYQSETVARMQSATQLSEMGKALLIYANEHEDRFPRNLASLREVEMAPSALSWLQDNVTFLGQGVTVRDRPDRPIAYDRTLLRQGQGTNVLYLDAHVAFETPERLRQLGIRQRMGPPQQAMLHLTSLALAVIQYANDNGGQFPATLEALQPYVANEATFTWAQANAEYLGKGLTTHVSNPARKPLAYWRTGPLGTEGTVVVFVDRHVESVSPERFAELGLSATPAEPEPTGVWITFLPRSPIRSLAEYHHAIQVSPVPAPPGYRSVPFPACDLEIRRAADQQRVARIYFPESAWTPSELTPEMRRRIGELPDGEYLMAFCYGNARCSNVARLRLDSQYDPSADPTLSLVPLPVPPGGSPVLLGIRVVGPRTIDPELTNQAVAFPLLVVDGTERRLTQMKWAGPVGPVQPGQQEVRILRLSEYEPTIEPGRTHSAKARVGKYESALVQIPAAGDLARRWDGATENLAPYEPPSAVLQGKVVGTDGLAGRGYEVCLFGDKGERIVAVADEDGSYDFVNIPSGPYQLICNPKGRGQPCVTINSVTLAAGRSPVLNISLEGRYRLGGTVAREDGSGVARMDVTLTCEDPDAQAEFQDSVLTDEQGRFELGSPYPQVTYVGVNGRRIRGSMPQLSTTPTRLDIILGEDGRGAVL